MGSVDDPDSWRWVWLIAALAFGLGEMATPGSFFLAPFAIGAAAAAVLAFADAPVVVEWAAFVGLSLAFLFALRPIARRLDRSSTADGVGSRRLIGRAGVVVETIPQGDLGLVRVEREEWRAVTADGAPIAAGTPIRITDIEGTKVVVTLTSEPGL